MMALATKSDKIWRINCTDVSTKLYQCCRNWVNARFVKSVAKEEV